MLSVKATMEHELYKEAAYKETAHLIFLHDNFTLTIIKRKTVLLTCAYAEKRTVELANLLVIYDSFVKQVVHHLLQ